MLKIKHDVINLTEEIINDGPKKTNTSSARQTYIQENLFQTTAYKNNINKPISFSLFNQHYGKLNNDLMSLVPVRDRTVIINSEQDLSVLDFVSDAYFAFMRDLQDFKSSFKISSNSKFWNFEAKGTKEDLDLKYDSFLKDQYSYFVDFVNSKKTQKNIKDLDSFLLQFTNFVDSRTPLTPYNKSSFLYSNRISRKVSGLVIDLDLGDVNDDKNKFDNYTNHEDFSCFQDLANSHGFVVNKDIPWQIVANLNSVNMKYYFHLRMLKLVQNGIIEANPVPTNKIKFEDCKDVLENFDLTNQIFDPKRSLKFFEIINYKDLENLKNLIYKFYNSFIRSNFKLTTTELVNEFGELKIQQKTQNRKLVLRSELETPEIRKKIIRLYVYIKARETNAEWSQSKFETVVNQMSNLEKALDIEHAMRYLQHEINFIKISKEAQRNFYF